MSEAWQADVVVIGMGPGGENVAGSLAEAGLEVVGIDRRLLGGECPYWGCVPSKMMIRAGNLLAEARRIPGLAGDALVRPDWAPVAKRIREEATDNWDDRVAVERFEGKGGRFLRGTGRISAPGEVVVSGSDGSSTVVQARRAIVVATGTEPVIPPIPGLADVPYWTNREAIETETLPRSLIVLGGGTVGVELGQVFARFGTAVSVVESEERLIGQEEPEAGDVVGQVFAAEGIAVHTGAEVTAVRADGSAIVVELRDGPTLSAEHLLVATGRRADLDAVGMGAVGIDTSQRGIPVDENLRAADGVWAIGDVTGAGPFTHVAVYQAPLATADILGEPHPPADYRALPRVTFTDPEVGAVGRTERQARDAGVDVRTGLQPLPENARGWIHKAGNQGFVKLVEDADRGVLVGGTAVGPSGGEVLGLLSVAVHAEVPTESLRRMIYAYPTFHRAVEEALRDLDSG